MTDQIQLDNDVKRYTQLDSQRADIDVEMADIKARLRSLGSGVHAAPCGISVSVTPNRRFNADKCAEVLPPQLLEQVQSLVVDSKKAKAVLPPALYEAAMIEVGDPRVIVR